MWSSVGLLAGGLGLVAVSGIVLSGDIERVAERLHFSAALLGIVSALGADAPEISSALAAIGGGHRDVGLGVVLGSNVYNLSVILGLSALLARKGVRVGKKGLILNGGVALAVTVLAALLVVGALPAWLTFALVLAVLVPYVAASALRSSHLEQMSIPAPARHFLCEAVANVEHDIRRSETPRPGAAVDALSMIPALASIVLGSFAMVAGAVELGRRCGIRSSIVGSVLLAALTGLPNTIAGVRLALRGRGTAVLSEALNSNSVNVLFGLCTPALVLGHARASVDGIIALAWLGGLTVATLALGALRGGMRKSSGALLLALYAAFVIVEIVL